MRNRQFIGLLLSLLLVIPTMFFKPIQVFARNYAVQIKDSQDVKNDSDLKTLSMKEDFDYLYIKLDSWKTWSLESSNSYIDIYLIMGNARTPKYELFVIEGNKGFEGGVFNMETEEITPITVNFDRTKSQGTMQIEKKAIEMTLNNFSFLFYTSVLSNPGHYYDAAPDDQSFIGYAPGPNTDKPMLDVSSINIQAGDVKKDEITKVKFDVMNKGEGSVSAAMTTSANIRLDVSQITLNDYETRAVVIFISANKLVSQNYTETIEIKSDFGSYSISVTFFVLPEPKLEIDKEAIDFGPVIKGEKKVQKIVISNKAKGPIKVSLDTKTKWLILNKTSFEEKSEEIIVSLSTKAMEPGINEGEIKVTSNGGSAVIPVSVEILSPLAIDKTEFDFGEIDSDDPKFDPIPFTLKNQTAKSMTVKISCTDPWIGITPEIEIEAQETKELKVALKLNQMTAINKSYQCEISFETNNDTFKIPVRAYLKQEPPKTLWISDPPNQKTIEEKLVTGKMWEKIVTIKNEGSGVMAVTAKLEDSKSDFRLFNNKFSLKKGETSSIKIKFDSTGLKLGPYKNVLLLESNGGNLTIPIILDVQPKPVVVIKLYIGLSLATINDKQLTLDAPPYISKGTTLVPLRFISDAFQAKIEWFTIGKGRILMNTPTKSIQIDIGEPFAFINSEKLPLTVPAEIKSGRTFVPLRFIAQGLGATIDWKADTQQITILYTVEE